MPLPKPADDSGRHQIAEQTKDGVEYPSEANPNGAYATEESGGIKSRLSIGKDERWSSNQEVRRTQSAIHEESRRYSITSDSKPWLADDGKTLVWSQTRIRLAKVIRLQQFEGIMGIIIVFNLFLIIYETDHEARCHPPEQEWANDPDNCPYRSDRVPWIKYTNLALLIIYTAEAAVRIYVERTRYFWVKWNVLDFSVVCVGWLSEVLGGVISLAFLRIFRIARLSRAFRIVLTIRELYMLITGLGSAMKAIFFGMVLLFGMLTLWAIVLVDFVHPVNSKLVYDGCDRCSRGYASVKDSVLTVFQQIVAGDSWGLISVPVIEESPWLALILVSILISVSLGVMNLILAVIVESAAEARESDLEQKTKQKLDERRHKKMELLKLCIDLDKDMSDTISLEEMERAWEESPRFRSVMAVLEVSRDDLGSIFKLLDYDASGEVDYREFVDRLYALRTSDVRLKLEQLRIDLNSHISLYHQRHQEHEMKLDRHFQLLLSIDKKLVNLSSGNGFSKPGNVSDVMGGRLAAEQMNGVPQPVSNGMPQPVSKNLERALLDDENKPLLRKSFSLTMPQGDDYQPEYMRGAEAGLPTNRSPASNVVMASVIGGPSAPLEGKAVDNAEFIPFHPSPHSFRSAQNLTAVSSGVRELQQHIEQLAKLKANIVRKAEVQARDLQRHAAVLSSVQSALLHGSVTGQRVDAFGKTLHDLDRHVQQRLALIMRNLNGVVDQEGVDLATIKGLIDALNSHTQPHRSGAG